MAEASKVYEKGGGGVDPILSDVYEIMNDCVYTVQCPKGHTGKVVLKNLHFELFLRCFELRSLRKKISLVSSDTTK